MPRKKNYDENEVLQRAMWIFWSFGYDAANVRLLEKEMGINQFSIYSSFKNKKNLYLESLRAYSRYMLEKEFLDLSNEETTINDLKMFLKNCIEKNPSGLKINGCMVVNAACSRLINDEDIQEVLKTHFSSIKNMLCKIIQNSLQKKEVSNINDIDKSSNYLLGIMQGFCVGLRVLSKNQLHDYIEISFSVFE